MNEIGGPTILWGDRRIWSKQGKARQTAGVAHGGPARNIFLMCGLQFVIGGASKNSRTRQEKKQPITMLLVSFERLFIDTWCDKTGVSQNPRNGFIT